MSKVVRVKVVQTGAVKTMTDIVAERLVKAMPKQYVILENPIIEAVKLPPVQKKSVEVVEGSLTEKTGLTNTKINELIDSGEINLAMPKNIGNPPPSLATEQATQTTQTTEDVLTPKRGRPFKNQA